MNVIDFGAIGKYTVALLPYIPVTLALSVLAMVLGIALGLVMALIKMSRIPVLSQINAVLVSYLRGTPILVQLLLNVNAVPIAVLYINDAFGTEWDALGLSPFVVAAFTFALHEAAYASETIRAALGAVDRRETEAAQALGMTPWQTLKRITIPVASVIAFPTLVSQFIGMLKQSSLAFVVSVVEVTAYAKIIGGRDYRFFEAYLATAIVYWALTVVIEQFSRRFESGMQRPRKRSGRPVRPGTLGALARDRGTGSEPVLPAGAVSVGSAASVAPVTEAATDPERTAEPAPVHATTSASPTDRRTIPEEARA